MTDSKKSYSFPIDHYSIDLLGELGRGQFGILYKGTDTRNNREVAAKKLNYQTKGGKSKNDVILKMATNELEIFRALSGHKNIVQLLHFCDDGENYWLVLEFCDLGNLNEYLQSKTLELTARIKIMCECASAISFMHSFIPPLVHRDIKPENILMKKEGKTDIVKVTDFGVGKMYEMEKNGPIKLTMNTLTGSLFYMAPEFFTSSGGVMKYQPTVDTFSLGLLFFVVLLHDGREAELRPMSIAMQKAQQDQPFGFEMANAINSGTPLPTLFEDIPNDDHIMKQLKFIISSMSASVDDRIRLHNVMSQLMDIHSSMLYEEMDKCTTREKELININKKLSQENESQKKIIEDLKEKLLSNGLELQLMQKKLEEVEIKQPLQDDKSMDDCAGRKSDRLENNDITVKVETKTKEVKTDQKQTMSEPVINLKTKQIKFLVAQKFPDIVKELYPEMKVEVDISNCKVVFTREPSQIIPAKVQMHNLISQMRLMKLKVTWKMCSLMKKDKTINYLMSECEKKDCVINIDEIYENDVMISAKTAAILDIGANIIRSSVVERIISVPVKCRRMFTFDRWMLLRGSMLNDFDGELILNVTYDNSNVQVTATRRVVDKVIANINQYIESC